VKKSANTGHISADQGPVEMADAAWDLTGLLDLDSVFAVACHWARQLIGSVDMACLLETNPDASQARVRAVSGAVSTHLEDLRIRSGEGLVGQVLQTGSPLSSENYRTDVTFRHTAELDALMPTWCASWVLVNTW
jgi:GAF domain-containing protein